MVGSLEDIGPVDGRSNLDSCRTKDDCLFMVFVDAIKGGLLPVNTASTELNKLRALLEPLLLAAAALPLSI